MTQPHGSSRPHRVTLDTKSVKVLSKPRPEQQASSVQGPFNLSAFLVCVENPIGPGQRVGIGIGLRELGIGLARTVTASVTELSPPSTPWQGAARFLTYRVAFDQQNQTVGVEFSMEWDSPLPVAVMLTIGHT